MKYLDIVIDLRTYDIFSITARSFIPETTVRDNSENDGKTILDLLEDKIKEYMEEDCED